MKCRVHIFFMLFELKKKIFQPTFFFRLSPLLILLLLLEFSLLYLSVVVVVSSMFFFLLFFYFSLFHTIPICPVHSHPSSSKRKKLNIFFLQEKKQKKNYSKKIYTLFVPFSHYSDILYNL